MTGPVVGRIRAKQRTKTGDDATVIEKSWGDPAHFGVLFDKHAPVIYRYIARRIGRQGSDDLVAETFMAAFGGRHRYDLAREMPDRGSMGSRQTSSAGTVATN